MPSPQGTNKVWYESYDIVGKAKHRSFGSMGMVVVSSCSQQPQEDHQSFFSCTICTIPYSYVQHSDDLASQTKEKEEQKKRGNFERP